MGGEAIAFWSSLSAGVSLPPVFFSVKGVFRECTEGVFASLFDMSFTEFVTTRIIHVLYIIAIVLAGIGALSILGSGFATGRGAGILGALIVAPLMFIFWVLMSRVWLEVIIVAFRIAENTGRLVEQGEGGTAAAGTAPETGPETPSPDAPTQPDIE